MSTNHSLANAGTNEHYKDTDFQQDIKLGNPEGIESRREDITPIVHSLTHGAGASSDSEIQINDIKNDVTHFQTELPGGLKQYPGAKLDSEADYVALFRKSILNQLQDYPPPVPVINLIQDGEVFPMLTKKSFSLWQGRQKSKKTTALAMGVAAFIKTEPSSDIIRFEAAESGIAIYFDCEQGESYAAKTMHLILKLAGLKTSENLIYCDLREMSPSDRMGVILAAINSTPGIKVVIIDGIVDLMDDFMDAKQGHTIVTTLLRLSSEFDIHVAGVLHQNKGGAKEARAHVGSISSQKCEREIMVEVDSNDRSQSIVTCKESRGMPFNDFAIRWDMGSLPCIVQDWTPDKVSTSKSMRVPSPKDIDPSRHTAIIDDIFIDKPEMIRSELVVAATSSISMHLNTTIGINNVGNWIKHWEQSEYIKVTGTRGTKAAKYSINKLN